MHYRNLADLSELITRNLHRIPRDIDLVVGIPRSGILPAVTISLMLNVRYADFDTFLEGRLAGAGSTKQHAGLVADFDTVRHVLVVDDSLNRGCAMREVRQRLQHLSERFRFTFAAAYVVPDGVSEVDIAFEVLPLPRMFEWNFIHHVYLQHACVDIDGVLCLDPCEAENDDGANYLRFLQNAAPLYKPTARIACLVTSRLEKYRPQTEAWLERQGIQYDKLVMLDLPSAAERRRLGLHASYKGQVYRDSKAMLFIESEYRQAVEIARVSGKPVLSIEGQQMIMPGGLAGLAQSHRLRNFAVHARMSDSPLISRYALARRMRRVLPKPIFEGMRTLYVRVFKSSRSEDPQPMPMPVQGRPAAVLPFPITTSKGRPEDTAIECPSAAREATLE